MGFIVFVIFCVWTFIGYKEFANGQAPGAGFNEGFKAGPFWWARQLYVIFLELKSSIDKM